MAQVCALLTAFGIEFIGVMLGILRTLIEICDEFGDSIKKFLKKKHKCRFLWNKTFGRCCCRLKSGKNQNSQSLDQVSQDDSSKTPQSHVYQTKIDHELIQEMEDEQALEEGGGVQHKGISKLNVLASSIKPVTPVQPNQAVLSRLVSRMAKKLEMTAVQI